jgi:PAS domain S-box-containing protein
MPLLKTKHLSDKIFAYTMVCYLAVVFVITFWLVAETHKSAKKGVFRELDLYESAFGKSLTETLWAMDMNKLLSLVQGILKTQGTIGIRIVDPNNGEILIQKGWTIDFELDVVRYDGPDGEDDQRAEKKKAEDMFVNSFPLIYDPDNTDQLIGKVTLFSDKGVVFERIKPQVLLIIAGAVCQILILWIVFSWISRRFLSRPLIRLTNSVESFDLDNPEAAKEPVLVEGEDELAILSQSFSVMQKRLVESVQSLRQKQDELRALNENLERLVAERTSELKDSEERLAQIIDFLPDPTWVIDNESKVVTWNRAIERLLGIQSEDMLGKGDFEYALPFYGKRRPVLIDLVRDWRPEYEKEYVSVKKDGDNLISESFHPNLGDQGLYLQAVAALLCNAKGEVSGAIESLRDITDRKQAELEMRKLSRAIEESPTSVVITDPDGVIKYVNPKFVEVTGYSADEAIGQIPRVLGTGKEYPEHLEDLWSTVLKGDDWHGEFCNTRKNGENFWEFSHISSIRNDEGDIAHFVLVNEDITERKRMEEELIQARQAADEANKAKGDFLANMSHEIRTPMNAVIGMAYLALKTDLTAKQRDYLKKIQSSANSLLGIINDILDFSKIEAGKLDMELVDFSLDEALENVANLITVKAQEKENLEVLFDVSRQVPRFLVGDSLRLGQVILNLANNAVKFTESGEIVVSTELVKQDEASVTLKFSVKDTGIGLTEEQKGRLFESFSQADTSTTRKYGGTGLGLTISKRLVEMMGGKIWVESETGSGSTFSFTATFGLGKEKGKKRHVPSDLRGLKVLVVDDSVTSRKVLREILESFSFQVTVVSSGEEALAELEKASKDHPFELVVMDWKMPGMDGIETSKRIMAQFDGKNSPTIIMVTAYGREEVLEKAEKVGLDGFLLKPVSPSILFDTILQAVGKEAPLEAQADREKDQRVAAIQHLHGARILLVEDNEINRQIAIEVLEGAGLKVSIAINGQEGVNAIMNNAFDAVLMDVQMPVMDGYEATRAIRSEARFKDLPIIAMTAHAMAKDRDECLRAGMDDHLSKPIDPDALYRTLEKWIKRTPFERPVGAEEMTEGQDKRSVDQKRDELPPLDGIDMEAGLKRVLGNRKTYRKVLVRFYEDLIDADKIIKTLVSEEKYNEAQILVHTIKGTGANLGAEALQGVAGTLEKWFKEGGKGLPESDFGAFCRELNRVRDSLSILAKEKKQPVEEKEETVSLSSEVAKEIAQRLRDAVDVGDVGALSQIASELSVQEDTASYGEKIARLVDDFDFDGISDLADKLEEG